MHTKAGMVDKLWLALRQAGKGFTIPADPRAEGPYGLAVVQAKVMAAWRRVNDVAGAIYRAEANAKAKIVRMKNTRRMKADLMSSDAHNDPGLRMVRTVPARLKATIASRLADEDATIAGIEADVESLSALKQYARDVVEEAKAAKEVLRQQVDLLAAHRLADGSE